MSEIARKHASTVLIGILIGAPLTALALQWGFWLSHGAGYLGAAFLLLAVPGMLVGPWLGWPGIIVAQAVYYFYVARGVKALVRKVFFSPVSKHAS